MPQIYSVPLVSTFVSTASNYSTSGASSTLSTLSMSNVGNQQWPGGAGVLQMGGTMAGGTVSLGYVDPIGNSVTYTSMTTLGGANFTLPQCQIFISSASSAGRTVAIAANVIPTLLA